MTKLVTEPELQWGLNLVAAVLLPNNCLIMLDYEGRFWHCRQPDGHYTGADILDIMSLLPVELPALEQYFYDTLQNELDHHRTWLQ